MSFPQYLSLSVLYVDRTLLPRQNETTSASHAPCDTAVSHNVSSSWISSIFFSIGLLILTPSVTIYHDFIGSCNISFIIYIYTMYILINFYINICIYMMYILIYFYINMLGYHCSRRISKKCTLFKMQEFSLCYYRGHYENTKGIWGIWRQINNTNFLFWNLIVFLVLIHYFWLSGLTVLDLTNNSDIVLDSILLKDIKKNNNLNK